MRPRKKAFSKLPKYVYAQRKRIIYRPPGERAIVLGNLDTPIPEIWNTYRQISGESKSTLDFLIDQYLEGDAFKRLATKNERRRQLDRLRRTNTSTGTFGSKRFASVTPGTIRRYLDFRANVAGNREISALSAAWSYCYQRDIVKVPNPCKGVSMIKETPRDKYVTESEYKAVYKLAPEHVQIAMELAYLCRLRIGEIYDIRVSDIEDDGLHTRRGKGSDSTLTRWTPRLRDAVDRGLKGRLRVQHQVVVAIPVRKDTFSKQFSILVKRAGVEKFTFHDLKAKGVSDFEGDKKKASGHKSERMVRVYDRKRIEIDATD